MKYIYIIFKLESLDELKRRIQYKANLSQSEKVAIKKISSEAKTIRKYLSECKNEYFGSIFRSENNPTLFALDTMRYADLYTSKLENFADYPCDCKFLSSVLFNIIISIRVFHMNRLDNSYLKIMQIKNIMIESTKNKYVINIYFLYSKKSFIIFSLISFLLFNGNTIY